MRPEVLTAVLLRAAGLPTVGEMVDLIIKHKSVPDAILEAELQGLEWSVIALRNERFVKTKPADFVDVLRALPRLHRADFIYDGRQLP